MTSPATKRKARYRINNAIRDGHIKRPDRCQWCHTKPGRGKDGRSLIQFHHYTYRHAAMGQFICSRCHRKAHQ